jgi:peptidoglycan/xylan/chitin deacetylase (PgdA/CDA1 family)
MKKLFFLLLVAVGAYFALKKWSPHTLERIAFWKSGPPAPPPTLTLPPAEPAPTPAPKSPPSTATTSVQPANTAAPGTATAPPTQPGEPPKPALEIDKTSQVVVLLYHRFEGSAGGMYSITPEVFEEHLQKLKDSGVEIISMSDFLAWRRGEKNIPHKAALITIDDGYASAYDIARPILKKHGYPWTYFIYTKYVGAGGKSITWEQLAELHKEGVEIGSHTISHIDLRTVHGRSSEAYEQWLHDEIVESRHTIEKATGGRCIVFAYPAGGWNQKVRDVVKEAGYEAAFTAYGQRITYSAPEDLLGRYAWSSRRPQDIKQALDFNGSIEASREPPVIDATPN